ncbi:outer membrane protein assembly factor BamD [Devosia sp. 66-22]|uniref:outer membrane protein assembly factor BamD n=1 Tax=Devosia sp. 66-22 TaxID=1895753 RepID=UPI000AEF4CFC|nr:outer membrane protein assembly factor BamD [Devosia sp. 66-22]
MTDTGFRATAGNFVRLATVLLLVATVSACSMFGPSKIKDEEIIPAETLYQTVLSDMDKQRYNTAIENLKKLERQHPYSEYNEKAKLMEVYANYRIGKFDEAILAADRYMALFPSSEEMPYVLFLKGTSYFAQITDITRDQQLSQDAIATYTLLIANYPKSDYAKDARDKMVIAVDQLAGKEMSVGRYYAGNGQYAAAINRFRVVVDKYQTSTHIEEALFRLTESNLALGLTNEAQTAAAVLGHNYPSSSWYKDALGLLQKVGLQPKVNSASPLAASLQG